MAELGYPLIFDATHSVQLPGALGAASGGQRQFVSPLARAAVAVGCDALFLEVHEDPERALCDGPNMLRLQDLPSVLAPLQEIHEMLRAGSADGS
jgi:2-dehydro-3-deoxyphosphooctonate aldolase (KDO 8-P synthase)